MEELTRKAVKQAIKDFDDKGSNEFFRHFRHCGIRRSRSYFIRYKGQEYDMKAIARVARFLTSGERRRAPLGQSREVAQRLHSLGIKVVHYKQTFDQESTEGCQYWARQRKAERDPRLARKAMELNRNRHDGWITCEACGFRDKERSMFDAHHLTPLSLGERRSCVCDFAVLCPTCHRWAHAKAGDWLHPLPVEQVRRGRRRACQRNRR